MQTSLPAPTLRVIPGISPRPATTQTPTVRQREPYAVERYPSAGGGVLLVGYDGRGEAMMELRVSTAKFSMRAVDGLRWLVKATEGAVTHASLVK